jgi:hypothetical protein
LPPISVIVTEHRTHQLRCRAAGRGARVLSAKALVSASACRCRVDVGGSRLRPEGEAWRGG